MNPPATARTTTTRNIHFMSHLLFVRVFFKLFRGLFSAALRHAPDVRTLGFALLCFPISMRRFRFG